MQNTEPKGDEIMNNIELEVLKKEFNDNPFVIGAVFIDLVDDNLTTLATMDKEQCEILEVCSGTLEVVKKASEHVMKFCREPAEDKEKEDYQKAKSEFELGLKKVMDEIKVSQALQKKMSKAHQTLKDRTIESNKQMRQSSQRKTAIPKLRECMQAAASCLKINTDYEILVNKSRSSQILIQNFDSFRNFCLDFVFPYTAITNPAFYCKNCVFIAFISRKVITPQNSPLVFVPLKTIIASKEIPEKAAIDIFFKGIGLVLALDEEAINDFRFPGIFLPSKEQRMWHPCLKKVIT